MSLSFLIVTGAFLSTKTVLASSSFSTDKALVANNTSKTQLSVVNSVTNPDVVSVPASQSSQLSHPAWPQTDRSNSVIFHTHQADVRDDRFTPNILASTQTDRRSSILSTDVENLDLANKISATPAPTISEPFIEILVPPPRTQTIQVRPVKPFTPVVKNRTMPSVVAIPTVRAAANPPATLTPIVPINRGSAPVITVPSVTPINNDPTPSSPVAPIDNGSNQTNVVPIYPLLNPAPITSRFGWRTHPLTGSRRFHSGVDMGAPMGAPVVATAAGTVVSAGWNGGYGKAVVIQHNNVRQTLYGHLSEISVQPGQVIAQGTVLGLVGSTGNSTGPHLHFENRTLGTNGWTATNPSSDIHYALDNLRRSLPSFAQRDLPPGL